MKDLRIKVLPTITDHKAVLVHVPVHVAEAKIIERQGWIYKHARWRWCVDRYLCTTDWSFIFTNSLDDAAERFTLTILAAAKKHIPMRNFSENKSQHPWLNQTCRDAITGKHESEGTPQYVEKQIECSDILMKEYEAYIARTRRELQDCKRGSKKWWQLNAVLLRRKSKACSIPAMKHESGEWLLDAEDKANLFAITWMQKYVLRAATNAEFPWPDTDGIQLDNVMLRSRWALKFLLRLDVSKATGPDLLPARILKEVAQQIYMPLIVLCRRMLIEGHWPASWRTHRLCPLYKRLSVYDANNYRGVHITCILSKVAERIIGGPLLRFFETTNSYGKHQWAYRKHRSSSDLITLLVCSWLFSFCAGNCIGAFLNDISGAFDKVFTPFMLAKLRALGIGRKYMRFLSSYLEKRSGVVCVAGSSSSPIDLENPVFQDTVLGPPLWNVFFADVITSIVAPSTGKAFADDLNAFQSFGRNVHKDIIFSKLRKCQDHVHKWGEANRVDFDPGKEELVILHPRNGYGETFRLLGLMVDNRLTMDEAVAKLLKQARPKCVALLRTRVHYGLHDMFLQYKTHILGILESITGGIYHATTTVLAPLDRLQTTFVHALNLTVEDAFLHHNLAPLCLRRDIAMLGFLHKVNLPDVHDDMLALFPPKAQTSYAAHNKQLWSLMQLSSECTFYPEMAQRSIFYLVHVYNALPQHVIDCKDITSFQHGLTELARTKLQHAQHDWHTFLSPRSFNGSLNL